MRSFTALLVLVALAAPIDAEHCSSYSTSHHDVGAAGVYVDGDICPFRDTCLTSVWIYQESNGIDGLQRGDEVVDDTCHGMIDPDTVIF